MGRRDKRAAEIRSAEVWLFDEDGTDLGFLPAAEAQRRAAERGLDLVPDSQPASPPRYRLASAAVQAAAAVRAARMARSATEPPKEIRVRVSIGAADLETRRQRAATLLTQGHRVKLRVELDPARRSDPAPARALLDGLVTALAPVATLERKPFSERGAVAAILAPR